MSARSAEALRDHTASISSLQSIDLSAADVTLAGVTRGVYVGGSGDLVVQCVDDNASVKLVSILAGVWHPIQVQKFIKTGTTATGIVAGY